jgi:hypothetical protein
VKRFLFITLCITLSGNIHPMFRAPQLITRVASFTGLHHTQPRFFHDSEMARLLTAIKENRCGQEKCCKQSLEEILKKIIAEKKIVITGQTKRRWDDKLEHDLEVIFKDKYN